MPTVRCHQVVAGPARRGALAAALAASLAALPAGRAAGPGDAPAGGGGGWELSGERDGIRVFRRRVAGSSLLSFRGVGEVDAPLAKVAQIVLDLERAGEWAARYERGRVLRWIDRPWRGLVHVEARMPLFVKNRDFVSFSTIVADPAAGTLRVDYEADRSRGGRPVGRGNVLGDLSGSHFTLRSLDGGRRTLVDGVAVVDLKGRIPAWLINVFQADWPYRTLVALRRQAGKDDVGAHPLFSELFP